MTKLRNYSANNISLIFSSIISLFLILILHLANLLIGYSIPIHYTIIIFVLCFSASFFTLRYLVSKFISRRLKSIYKTISKEKTELRNKSNNYRFKDDNIEKVEKDIEAWVNEQKSKMEIMTKMMEFRKEYVGNVSHELKTPIFNIQGFTLTLLEGGLEDKSINKKYLQKIDNNINRMIDIVSSLETITKIGSEGFTLNYEKINPINLCKGIIEDLEEIAKKKNIRIKIQKKYSKDIFVNADKELITQVFTNIIINSIYYNNENGKIDIDFSVIDKIVFIEISDNGIGIAPEDLDRIFERFYRIDRGRTLNEKGHGLGLSIVKNIIEAHEQTVNINSSIGVGTTISFTLDKFE